MRMLLSVKIVNTKKESKEKNCKDLIEKQLETFTCIPK